MIKKCGDKTHKKKLSARIRRNLYRILSRLSIILFVFIYIFLHELIWWLTKILHYGKGPQMLIAKLP